MKTLVVATGGTFGSSEGDCGLTVNGHKNLKRFEELLTGSLREDVVFTFVEAFSKLSENIIPSDWEAIANTLKKNLPGHDNAIVIHGTDTMAYSSAAISYLSDISQHYAVVFTGANIPLSMPNSDGQTNFLQSVQALKHFQEKLVKGVFIVFNGLNDHSSQGFIHLGSRSKKDKWEESCYRSFYINGSSIGEVNGLREIKFNDKVYNELIPKSKNKYFLTPEFSSKNIAAFKVYPGFDPKYLDAAVSGDAKYLILEIYNSGTATADDSEYSLVPFIEHATKKGVIVFAVSQHEGKRGVSMDVYESSSALLSAGIVPLRDMVWEAALPKLMLANGNFSDPKTVVEFMSSNIAGEIIDMSLTQEEERKEDQLVSCSM